ncbi:MAG: tetratricopeptide repeat protein [Phycisphaerae bacterium]
MMGKRIPGTAHCGIALISLASTMGCHTTQHATAKLQAQQRWGTVRAEIKLQLAQQAFDHFRFAEAAEAASEAIALDATLLDGHVLLAQSRIAESKTSEARRIIATARRAGLAGPELDYTEGMLLEWQGRPEEALALYARARSQHATRADYLIAQVECLVALDRAEVAMRLLNETRRAFDDNPEVMLLAGRTAEFLNQPRQAVRWLQDAYARGAGSFDIALAFGRALATTGRFLEAVSVLDPLLGSNLSESDESEVRRTLAIAHLAHGQAESALRVITPQAQRHEDDTLAQVLQARAALALGDTSTASRAIDRALRGTSKSTQPRILQALLQKQSGATGDAAATLFDVLADHPADVEAHCLLAEVMIVSKRFDAARVHFRKAIQLQPGCLWAIQGLQRLPQPAPENEKPPVKLTAAQ